MAALVARKWGAIASEGVGVHAQTGPAGEGEEALSWSKPNKAAVGGGVEGRGNEQGHRQCGVVGASRQGERKREKCVGAGSLWGGGNAPCNCTKQRVGRCFMGGVSFTVTGGSGEHFFECLCWSAPTVVLWLTTFPTHGVHSWPSENQGGGFPSAW